MTQNKSLSFINWVGGKSQLRKTIATFIPEDIISYIEPFGGGGWVLFYKERWAKCEVYNDINKDLYNLFNVTKYHPEALVKEFQLAMCSREMFNVYLKQFKPMTDIQRAAQFLFLLKYSYGGSMENFGYGRTRAPKSHENILESIMDVSLRLNHVYLENLDYKDILKRYDTPEAFFYLDPPYYVDSVQVYSPIDHEELLTLLKNLKGRFLLSYDDRPEIRELYKDFKIVPVSRHAVFSQDKSKAYNEVLIMNYKLDTEGH